MTDLLKLIPRGVWIAIALAALIGAGWLQYQNVISQRDAALARHDATAAQLEKSESEAAALQSALEWRRENARQLLAALEKHEQALATAQNEIQGYRDALDQIGEQDAEVRVWLDNPVPVVVADWLRKLRDHPDSADPGHTDGSASSDGTVDGARGQGGQPARPPGPAR